MIGDILFTSFLFDVNINSEAVNETGCLNLIRCFKHSIN